MEKKRPLSPDVLHKEFMETRECFLQYAKMLYERRNNRQLQSLKGVEFELYDEDFTEILDNIPKCLMSIDEAEVKRLLKKYLKLYHILSLKENCWISKIVDPI